MAALINGTADKVAPPKDTTSLVNKLHEQKGIKITHEIVAGGKARFIDLHDMGARRHVLEMIKSVVVGNDGRPGFEVKPDAGEALAGAQALRRAAFDVAAVLDDAAGDRQTRPEEIVADNDRGLGAV